MDANITDYIKYIKSIKNDKNYRLQKHIFYITLARGPHLDFYNNPVGFDGNSFDTKITKLRAKFIKGIVHIIECDKNKIRINVNVVQDIIKQLETCILNKEYWIRYGFNTDQSIRITSIYQMLIDFFTDYSLMKRKNTTVVGIGASETGNDLYKFLIKMNNGIDIDPVQLQLYAIKSLNKHIKEFLRYINNSDHDISNAIVSAMEFERTRGTYFESEKELLIESKKILMDLHEKTQKLFNNTVKIPNITKLTVKVAPSIDSKWSSKTNSDKNTIYIDTTKYKHYTREELYGMLAHEGLPGHLLEKTNEKLIIKNLGIEDDMYPICFRGIKMLHEGWAIYSNKLVNTDIKFTIMNSILYDIRAIIDIGLNCNKGIILTLDDATQLLKQCTRLSDVRIADEIQRYLTSPGEATSYIIGELVFDKICRIATVNNIDTKTLNTMLVKNVSTVPQLFERVSRF